MSEIFVTADLHLGSTFRNAQTAVASAQQMLDYLESMLQNALQKGARYFVICGDIFDSTQPPFGLEQAVMDKLGRYNELMILVVSGNHDPYDKTPFFKLPRPDNLMVFSKDFTKFEGEDVVFYGCSYYAGENTITPQIAGASQKLNILITHGELDGSDNNMPSLSSGKVIECGYDYVLMGHIHKRQTLSLANGARLLYPGIPYGRGYDEAGICGYYQLSTEGKAAALSFIPLKCHRYFNIETDVTGSHNISDITEKVRRHVNQCGEGCWVRATLTGFVPAGINLDAGAVLSATLLPQLKQISDKTRLDPQTLSTNTQNLKGLFCKKLIELRQNAGQDEIEIIDKALKFGLDALN